MRHDRGGYYQMQQAEKRLEKAARTLYIEERDKLAELIVRTLEPNFNEFQTKDLAVKVAKWMVGWEMPLRKVKRQAAAMLTPEVRLQQALEKVKKHEAILDALLEAETIQPSGNGPLALRTAHRTWSDAQKELLDLEKELGHEDERELTTPQWKSARKTAYGKFIRDYHGKGQVYKALCEQLASNQTILHKLEDEGRMESEVYRQYQAQFLAVATQIQKHTESLKTESIDVHVQTIGTRLLSIIEPFLYNQPALMDQITAAIERNVDNVIDGNRVLRLPERATA